MSQNPFPSPVLVAGGRHCSAPEVGQFVAALLASSRVVHVGCAIGADQAAILAAIATPAHAARLRVFAAFSQSGAGAWSGSAYSAVRYAHAAGASVSWLAGGALVVPLVARLMQRSLAALSGCSSAVFFEPGAGSLKVARAALKAGIPVLISQVGLVAAPVLPVAPLPLTWSGFSFWLYKPASQPGLF